MGDWAIPLNKDTPPIDDGIVFGPWDRRQHMLHGPGTDFHYFTKQPSPWDRRQHMFLVSFPDPAMGLGTRLHMLHDPGTDFHYFTTPRQMASKQPAPWDRRQHMLLVLLPDPAMGLGTRLHMIQDPALLKKGCWRACLNTAPLEGCMGVTANICMHHRKLT